VLTTALSTEIITANATLANTTGNAQLLGIFGANTLVATNGLRGGNATNIAFLPIVSDVVITGSYVNSSANLNVTALTTLVGNTSISSNSFSVVALLITGNTTSTNVTIAGNTLVITVPTITITGTSTLTGSTVLKANSTVSLFTANATAQTITVGGTLTNIATPVNVTGPTAIANTLIVTGANVQLTVLTAANTTINGFANVNGTIAGGNTTITGFANISAAASVGTNLSVTGNITAGAVTSTHTLNGSLVSNNHTVNGTLVVNGIANVGNTIVTGTLSTSAGATVNGAFAASNTSTFAGTIQVISDFVIDVKANTNVGLGSPVVYSFPLATYASGKFVIQIKNSGTVQASELVVATDGGINAYVTTYGTVSAPYTSNTPSPLGTFTARVNAVSSSVELVLNQVINSSAVKVVANLIKV
jgi:hypothetical protein